MKFRAKANINHNGTWIRPGAELELTEAEAKALEGAVEKLTEEPAPAPAPAADVPETAKRSTTRKRK